MTMPLAAAGDAGDFRVINDWARDSGWLHPFMTNYAVYGVALFALLIVLGWWLARRWGDLAAMAAVAWTGLGALIAVGVNQPITQAVAEQRPFVALPHVLVLVKHAADYGFTSDHATMAGAVATGLCYVDRRLGVGTWFAAIVLAFARVYIGAHYPHDVVAGLGLGAATVVVGRLVAIPLLRWLAVRIADSPLRPVIVAAGASRGGGTHEATPAA